MRVAVIFWRLGPYHHARLNAAGKVAHVFAIEASTIDSTYAWEKVEGAVHFTRITLQKHDPVGHREKRDFQSRIFRALDKINPEVVAIPGWSFIDALSALSWCVSRRKPVVLMSDSITGDAPRASWKEFVKRQVIKLCSSALVAGAPHGEYLKTLGMSPSRIFFGYDAVDNDYFAQAAKEARSNKDELRSKHGLPEKYFLVPARFIWQKNLLQLIEAYAEFGKLTNPKCVVQSRGTSAVSSVNSNGPDSAGASNWNLVLLGDGNLRGTLVAYARSVGLNVAESSPWQQLETENCILNTTDTAPTVFIPGFKQYSELPTYYGLASAMILPSVSETWGLVVNEAMASGLPVLVSNRCGCAQDLVQEGVNGFTFDPTNVNQLAGLMLKLSAFNFPLSAFGNASRQIIADWGPERFATGLEAAARKAMEIGAIRTSATDRMLLKLLCRVR